MAPTVEAATASRPRATTAPARSAPQPAFHHLQRAQQHGSRGHATAILGRIPNGLASGSNNGPSAQPPEDLINIVVNMRTLSNTQRFWIDNIRRPRPTRSQSIPGIPFRVRRHVVPSRASWFARKVNKASRYLKSRLPSRVPNLTMSIREGWNACISFVRRHQRTIAAIAMGSVLVLAANHTLANHFVHSQPSQLSSLSQHPPKIPSHPALSPYPSYLHAGSPITVLGLPPPLTETFIPPLSDIKDAWKSFSRTYHPDRWRINGFKDPDVAHHAYMLGYDSYTDLCAYWEEPSCYTNVVRILTASNYIDDMVPHFQPNARCDITTVLTNTLRTAAVPFFLQRGPPMTKDDLALHNPCTLGTALARRAYHKKMVAPPLPRFYEHPSRLFSLEVYPGSDEAVQLEQLPSLLHSSWSPSMMLLRWWFVNFWAPVSPDSVPAEQREMWTQQGWGAPSDFGLAWKGCWLRAPVPPPSEWMRKEVDKDEDRHFLDVEFDEEDEDEFAAFLFPEDIAAAKAAKAAKAAEEEE
ncbi:hypothetical protein BU26DRAFT_499984 [Trematosphaeria pertusa]|uniref:J domain-containing protein n=1 Tax=Trematosphaeria pertusa TaxID=390896 RepID=A0A6A6IUT3_9PLEO|nr:uncharacterized protein BU26DRAFT_499984 [Trematosphaeria pertusa]KAF2254179.1 hypothetical protein BU26DRAFT_499984 [Trematosphaeria pertusa]